ncbi:hypothetical protein ABZ023_11050 [Streptomyces sp. NPDC006367]|uniref:hypothetical protein n=1 Tax=unclassified Streptomyces TaxID=2593676 RepID=UPI0033B0E0D3
MTGALCRFFMWLSPLLRPGGTHRRTGFRPTVATAAGNPPIPDDAALPSHRSPYGLPTVLDGTETAAVRPYVLAPAPYKLEAAA